MSTFCSSKFSLRTLNGFKKFLPFGNQRISKCFLNIREKIPNVHNHHNSSTNSRPTVTEASKFADIFVSAFTKDPVKHECLLTASKFSAALGFWPQSRENLWNQKVMQKGNSIFCPIKSYNSKNNSVALANDPCEWGKHKEDAAIEKYLTLTKHDVIKGEFKVHAEHDWIGGCPDGMIYTSAKSFSHNHELVGILEVKCPYSNGRTELASPWKYVPFYYMPQVQGLMEIFGKEWLHLYCWTPNGSCVFEVKRDREYWSLIFELLQDFWYDNVLPARKASPVELFDTPTKVYEKIMEYKPSPSHTDIKEIIAISKDVSRMNANMVCKEVPVKPTIILH